MQHKNLIKVLVDLYNIHNRSSIEKAEGGYLTNNKIITTNKDKFFLKQYRDIGKDRILQIHKVLKYFNDRSISAVRPVTNSKNYDYFMLDGNYYALFPLVEGITHDRHEVPEEAVIPLAKNLSKMHKIAIENPPMFLTPKNTIEMNIDLSNCSKKSEQMLDYIENLNEHSDIDRWINEYVLKKRKLLQKYGEQIKNITLDQNCLIHGDYHVENVLFKGNKIVGVIDFDMSGMGNRIYEVVRSINISFFEAGINNKTVSQAKKYIESYQETMPINKGNIKKSFEFYFYSLISMVWAEEDYYYNKNKKVKRIMENEKKKIEFFDKHLAELVNNLTR